MATVRLSFDPSVEVEVSEQDLVDLTRQGLVLPTEPPTAEEPLEESEPDLPTPLPVEEKPRRRSRVQEDN